jgi:hypothetical protein
MVTKAKARKHTKDVFIGVLAGVGVLILTFLPGTLLFQSLGLFLTDLLLPDCRSIASCPDVIGFSPNFGGLIGMAAGIVAGRVTYKHRKGERVNIFQRPVIVWTIIALIVIVFFFALAFILFVFD